MKDDILVNQKILCVALPLAVFVFPHIFLITGGYHIFMMPEERETGFVENVTALFLLSAAIYGFVLAGSSAGRQINFFRPTIAFIGFCALWAGLEEISFGQHWFNFTTPAWFGENNYNNELNLHNIGDNSLNEAIKTAGYIVVTIIGIIVPLSAWSYSQRFPATSWIRHFSPPVWFIIPSLFHLLANLPKTVLAATAAGENFIATAQYFRLSVEYEEYMFGLWTLIYIALVHQSIRAVRNKYR